MSNNKFFFLLSSLSKSSEEGRFSGGRSGSGGEKIMDFILDQLNLR